MKWGGRRGRLKKGIRGPPVCRSCPIVGTGWGGEGERERPSTFFDLVSQGFGKDVIPLIPTPPPPAPFTSSDIPLSELLELMLMLAGPPSNITKYMCVPDLT